MGYDIFDEVDKLLSVVDQAVVSGDFTNLKDHVREVVEPMKQYGNDNRTYDGTGRGGQGSSPKQKNGRKDNNRRQDGRQGNYRTGYRENRGNYNSGHMENRGNAFYGSYSPGREYGQANPSNGPYRSGQNRYAGSVPRQTARAAAVDPLTGETELFKKVEGTLGNQVKQVIGVAGAVLSGLVSAIMIAVSVGFIAESIVGPAAVGIVFSLFSLGITAAFAALALNGRKGFQRMKRYVMYRSVLMKKSFASVKELAQKAGIPEEKVVRELKELTSLGFFKQGHFDKKETTFICADEVYRLYQASEESGRIREQEEAERRRQAGYVPDEVKELLDKGNEYVRKIHEANDLIPGEDVSRKLDRMENIVARIFTELAKNPSLAGKLNMFMDYYLPTTTKLIDAYIEMDSNPVQGANIQNSKREIEASLDTINDAYENLLDSFFKETALDVSTDISAMKNMMRQQGLTPDELEMIRRRQEEDRKLAGSPTIGEMQESMKEKNDVMSSAPTLENIRQQLAEEDARAGRKTGRPAEPEVAYTAPTLESIRQQLAEEDARAAREAERKAGEAAKAREAEAARQERPLSFDEQLELEAAQGLLMTGNGDDDDIF